MSENERDPYGSDFLDELLERSRGTPVGTGGALAYTHDQNLMWVARERILDLERRLRDVGKG